MGNISELPEDLLLMILSFVPTKDIVATSLVSKSWRCLWTKVSRLTYDSCELEGPFDPDKTFINVRRFVQYVKKSLLLHQPGALETLYIDFSRRSLGINIIPWIRTDVLCNLRELEVYERNGPHVSFNLPSVLFTCKKLVVLKLRCMINVELPSTVCLPSLKTLHFNHLDLLSDESIRIILSICPLLSDLRLEHHVMSNSHIVMPSLQRLTIETNSSYEPPPILLDDYIRSLEISTPSLKYLNIEDSASAFCVRVRIRSPSNVEDTSIYRRIVQLDLSMWEGVYEELLIEMLKRAINLSVLTINSKFKTLDWWKPPSAVPTCLLSSLQTLEWRGYNGSCAEMVVVSYFLKHALCLETAKIITESSDLFEKTKDYLLSVPRGSTTCRLVVEVMKYEVASNRGPVLINSLRRKSEI